MIERIRTAAFGVCLGIVGVAGVLLAIAPTRAEINRVVVLPEPLYLTLTIAGFILAVVAIVGLFSLVLTSAVRRPKTWYESRPVTRTNVQAVRELMQEFFGDETPSVTRMLQWQRQNKTVLTAVYRTRLRGGLKRSTIVGVYKIVPLTAQAIPLIEAERKTGKNIQAADIARESEKPAGLYIGDVAGVTPKAKGEVLLQLRHSLKKQMRPGISIYTRPLTSSGTRLVRRNNFVPIMNGLPSGSTGRIHRLAEDQAWALLNVEPSARSHHAGRTASISFES